MKAFGEYVTVRPQARSRTPRAAGSSSPSPAARTWAGVTFVMRGAYSRDWVHINDSGHFWLICDVFQLGNLISRRISVYRARHVRSPNACTNRRPDLRG